MAIDPDPATGLRSADLEWLEFEGRSSDARDQAGLEACRWLRRIVFVEEQAVPEALEWDGLDPEARHFLVQAPDQSGRAPAATLPARDRILGTARMRRLEGHAKAERVAVRADARRRGIGRLVMQGLEARAREEGLDAVVLHAQVVAIPFYASLGYRAHGEVFLDAGIDHRAMTKKLR
ncbi:MAG: GNAT family N-acetyltransferase [Myxococcota bacterium]